MAREKMSEVAKEIGALTIGALASKMLQNKVLAGMSFIPEKLKPVVPIAVGAFMVMKDKNGLIGDVGRGMIAEGGSSLGSKLIPGLSGLTGDDLGEISDNVDRVLNNVLNSPDDDEVGDDGLHDDLGDDGLHDDLGDDGLHDDLGDDGDEYVSDVEEMMISEDYE